MLHFPLRCGCVFGSRHFFQCSASVPLLWGMPAPRKRARRENVLSCSISISLVRKHQLPLPAMLWCCGSQLCAMHEEFLHPVGVSCLYYLLVGAWASSRSFSPTFGHFANFIHIYNRQGWLTIYIWACKSTWAITLKVISFRDTSETSHTRRGPLIPVCLVWGGGHIKLHERILRVAGRQTGRDMDVCERKGLEVVVCVEGGGC